MKKKKSLRTSMALSIIPKASSGCGDTDSPAPLNDFSLTEEYHKLALQRLSTFHRPSRSLCNNELIASVAFVLDGQP
jgi:hypothetical protein